jgi:hypothetical protein
MSIRIYWIGPSEGSASPRCRGIIQPLAAEQLRRAGKLLIEVRWIARTICENKVHVPFVI